uniref:Uncharacterized protein n=1 Tax=Chaetoceros debilis TaxID=122233 RepID=A0A7S3Q4R4_9STRA
MRSIAASTALLYLANASYHAQASSDSDGIIANAMNNLPEGSAIRRMHVTSAPTPCEDDNHIGAPHGTSGVYDDPDFHFPLANGSLEHCNWLSSNASALAYRRATYCVDPNIMGACPISCGTSQFDDPDFKFPISNSSMQSCSWITENLSVVAFRRSTYCPLVGVFCPETCGYFPNSIFPTPAPPAQGVPHSHPIGGGGINNPVGGGGGVGQLPQPPKGGKKQGKKGAAPDPVLTIPIGTGVFDDPIFHFPLLHNGDTQHCGWIASNQLSTAYRRQTYCSDPFIMGACPISCGANRFDDPNFMFPLNGNGSLQRCSWILASSIAVDYRRSTYCPLVGIFCPESCGYHPYNTFPSPSPLIPGGSSKAPTHSHGPGGIPGGGNIPIGGGINNPVGGGGNNNGGGGINNPVGGVYNNPDFQFPIDGGFIQNCAWITSEPSFTASRRATYCANSIILANCPTSCGTYQFDNPSFTFPINSDGSSQQCTWIVDNVAAIDYRRSTYCSSVGTFCPESCGYYPFGDGSVGNGGVPPLGGKKSSKKGGLPAPAPSPTEHSHGGGQPHFHEGGDVAHAHPNNGGGINNPVGGGGQFPQPPKGGKKGSNGPLPPTFPTPSPPINTPHSHPTNSGGGTTGNGGVPSNPSSPATSPVYDDTNFRFPLYNNGFLMPCNWLVSNNSAVASRRALYCNDLSILGACPISCGTSQYDDPSFTFVVNTNGNSSMQTCSWIMSNDIQEIDTRRSMYCPTVGRFCPVSCGYYPFSIFAAPAPNVNAPMPTPFAPTSPGKGLSPSKKGKKGASNKSNGTVPNPVPAPSPTATGGTFASSLTTSASSDKKDMQSSMVTVITVAAAFVWWYM